MKIRTDFVTNSSSYSSAEIMIDNPVLLEILMRYKEMGESSFPFSIGSGEFSSPPDVDPEDYLPDEKLGFSRTPALYTSYEDNWSVYPPENLDEIVIKIIELMDEVGVLDDQVKEELKKELGERIDEIKKAHRKIYWEFCNATNEYMDPNTEENMNVMESWVYTFSKKNGEKYHYIVTDDETGEAYEEKLVVDGKEIATEK